MGSGIASWFASQNIFVELVDVDQKLSQKALANIYQNWSNLVTKNKYSQIQIEDFKRYLSINSVNTLKNNYDLVIEAIIEIKDIKIELFKNLDKIMNVNTIFASNTSSISIASLTEGLPIHRQQKFLGLHFFNPAPVMKLVEVVKTEKTDKSLAKDLFRWFESHGKKPAVCKDSPGFIVNRVARNFYGEAFRIVETFNPKLISETDHVLEQVAGFKMGPFKLMDLIGIDVNLLVTESIWKATSHNPRFSPHSLQKKMVENGQLGKKTKKGFYDYE